MKILFSNGFVFLHKILTGQVKESVWFSETFKGKFKLSCEVLSPKQTCLHLVARPTSGPGLSLVARWPCPTALGLKERWANKHLPVPDCARMSLRLHQLQHFPQKAHVTFYVAVD